MTKTIFIYEKIYLQYLIIVLTDHLPKNISSNLVIFLLI